MDQPGLVIDGDRIALACQAHHISELWLYGSMVAGDYTPESDVDVMAVIDPASRETVSVPSLTVDLTTVFDRPADVVCQHRMEPNYVKAVRRKGIQLYGCTSGGNKQTERRTTASVR